MMRLITKFKMIGYYWESEDTVNKITNLLPEYKELFPTKFSDMKGIVGDLVVMKIPLKSNANPIK